MTEEDLEAVYYGADLAPELCFLRVRQAVTAYGVWINHGAQALADRIQRHEEVTGLFDVPGLTNGAASRKKRTARRHHGADPGFRAADPHLEVNIRLLAHPALLVPDNLILTAHAPHRRICKVGNNLLQTARIQFHSNIGKNEDFSAREITRQ